MVKIVLDGRFGRFGHPIYHVYRITHCFEVLDDLELRLEEEVGLPASHSDPWHILRPQQNLEYFCLPSFQY